MNVKHLRQVISRYHKAYFATIRGYLQEYESVIDIFPDDLKGPKHVITTFCSNGIVITYFDSVTDTYEFQHTNRNLELLVKDYIEAGNNFLSVAIYPSPEAAQQASSAPNPTNRFILNLSPKTPGEYEISGIKFHLQNVVNGRIMGSLSYVPAWQRMIISKDFHDLRWSIDQAQSQAKQDIMLFVSAHLVDGSQPSQKSPEQVMAEAFQAFAKANMVIEKLERSIQDFSSILEAQPKEEEIQVYLQEHPILLDPIAARILPKHKLGAEYITDFVIERPNKRYILVEIERASHALFTKAGDPSSPLTHAQRQVEDWRQWIQENIWYARNTLTDVNDPECWVIIGRRGMLSDADVKALNRKNTELKSIKLLTYDDLLDSARSHLHNLRQLGRGG